MYEYDTYDETDVMLENMLRGDRPVLSEQSKEELDEIITGEIRRAYEEEYAYAMERAAELGVSFDPRSIGADCVEDDTAPQIDVTLLPG